MRRARTALVALVVSVAAPAVAGPTGWGAIALRPVAEFPTEDNIDVAGHESHRQLRLCAMGGTVRIEEVDLRYASGERLMVPVMARLRRGACTGTIDLDAGERLTQVRVDYEAVRVRGSALLRIDAR